jgi:hypothetical protein
MGTFDGDDLACRIDTCAGHDGVDVRMELEPLVTFSKYQGISRLDFSSGRV